MCSLTLSSGCCLHPTAEEAEAQKCTELSFKPRAIRPLGPCMILSQGSEAQVLTEVGRLTEAMWTEWRLWPLTPSGSQT